MLLAAFTFGVLFLLVVFVGVGLFGRGTMEKQLTSAISTQGGSESTLLSRFRTKPAASIAAIVQPFQKMLPKTSAEMSVIQRRLIRAGYRGESYVNIFYGAKVVVPLGLALAATVTGFYEQGPFFVYAVALGVGFLVPDFVLGSLIKSRQSKITEGLCDFLDLMVVCIEAGLSLDQGTMRTTHELSRIHPALSDEVGLVILEQRAGLPRTDAWNHMAERTDISQLRTLVSMLIQADQFGTSIAKTMRTFSETLRVQRRQIVEEQAAKTTVKLVFPLVLFIFPSVFVVTLGPAFIAISDGFAKYFSQ